MFGLPRVSSSCSARTKLKNDAKDAWNRKNEERRQSKVKDLSYIKRIREADGKTKENIEDDTPGWGSLDSHLGVETDIAKQKPRRNYGGGRDKEPFCENAEEIWESEEKSLLQRGRKYINRGKTATLEWTTDRLIIGEDIILFPEVEFALTSICAIFFIVVGAAVLVLHEELAMNRCSVGVRTVTLLLGMTQVAMGGVSIVKLDQLCRQQPLTSEKLAAPASPTPPTITKRLIAVFGSIYFSALVAVSIEAASSQSNAGQCKDLSGYLDLLIYGNWAFVILFVGSLFGVPLLLWRNNAKEESASAFFAIQCLLKNHLTETEKPVLVLFNDEFKRYSFDPSARSQV